MEKKKGQEEPRLSWKMSSNGNGNVETKNGHKSSMQYVAKLRYSNNLPAPSCAAKLLKFEEDDEEYKDNRLKGLVSSYFRKQNFQNLIKLDDDLGMNMNLVNLPQRETVYGLRNNGMNLPLHPLDELLLADPGKNIKTKSENVSFLRRTQYISSDNKAVSDIASNNQSKLLNIRKDTELDSKSQLNIIENMFNTSSAVVDLNKIKHPTKKHLKAKKVWNFLPDTSMLDQKFYDIKFMSSASISKNRDNDKDKVKSSIKSIQDPKLLTSLLKEVEINATTKLVSFYMTNEADAVKIKTKLDDETENAPIDDEQLADQVSDVKKSFKYNKLREYDGSNKPLETLRQIAITFDEKSKTALYVPISNKMELKKCRIDPYLVPKIKESTYDEVDVFIVEPTKTEIENRDVLRSNFDPMEFGADDE